MSDLLTDGFGLRPYQQQSVDFVTRVLSLQGHCAVEAPTGSGKTIMALVSALEARREGEKILYLTRTNSQQEQVMADLSLISAKYAVKAVAMQGRGNLCLLYGEIEGEFEFSSESLSRFCSLRKRKVMSGDPRACRYFNSRIRSDEVRDFVLNSHHTAEQVLQFGSEREFCPYEAIKYHMKNADLVIAPYAYYLNRSIGDRLLYSMGTSRDRLIVILDECHNIPELARAIASFQISVEYLNRAEKEAVSYGDKELLERVRASDLIEMVRSSISSLLSNLSGDDRRMMFQDFLEEVMISAHLNSFKLSVLFEALQVFGEEIEQKMESDGKVPRSRLKSLGSRLIAWRDGDDSQLAAIISREEGGTIQAVCMDPSETLSVLRESRTVHFSGTLEPFGIYSRITGFQEMKHIVVPEVFPLDRRLFAYDDSISTKYDEIDDQMISRIRDKISDLVSGVHRKTIAFFPSYGLMEQVLDLGFEFPMLSEERGMSQSDTMDLVSDYRKSEMPLFAVAGGRLSEGMNFPGEQLEMVILAGIPYPRPDSRNLAIRDYYDRLYGRGWEYSVTFPTSLKVRQILGRLIRSDRDFGAGIILDHRAAHFRKFINGLHPSNNLVEECVNFFRKFENEKED